MRKNAALKKLALALGLLVLVYAVGVAGYMVLEGWSFQDASFMTVITLATVGYGEVHPLDAPGRWFTVVLILGGMGTLLYGVSTLTAFVVEGELRDLLWRTKMSKQIEKLAGHYIVCGAGRVGEYILEELEATGRALVLVEKNLAHLADRFKGSSTVLMLEGDPTSDEVLQEAGILRAKGLFAALGTDKDNLFVVLSARGLNPQLRIVARADDEETRPKLMRAGADAVICTSSIGGLRMASEMVRPAVVTFLDEMRSDRESVLRVEEALCRRGSHLDGKSLREAEVARRTGALVVALRRGGKGYEFNPPADRTIQPEDVLVVIGTREQMEALRKLAGEEP